MGRLGGWTVGLLSIGLLAGCRAAARVVEQPRVDLDLSQGNRGYLVGQPPPAAERSRRTRQMMEAEVELPGVGRVGRRAGGHPPVSLGEVAPPEVDWQAEEPLGEEASAERYDTYVVREGDTLWSIAAHPEVFGDATQWRRLYAANRDGLKSPQALKVGMRLRVPRDGEGGVPATDEAPSFRK